MTSCDIPHGHALSVDIFHTAAVILHKAIKFLCTFRCKFPSGKVLEKSKNTHCLLKFNMKMAETWDMGFKQGSTQCSIMTDIFHTGVDTS